VPAQSVFDEQYWFDTSDRVPCTEPHTTETALVARLEEPTVAAAKQLAKGCQTAVVNYVGLDPSENWIPWGWTAFIPTEEQLADGASWVRCEAAFPERWDFTRGRTTSVSASGIARDIPEDFWACLDQPPTELGQPFIPCDEPHNYEQTGDVAFLNGLDQYPSAAELAAETRRQCRPGIPAGLEGVSVTAAWDDPTALKEGTSIGGPCFIFSPDGEPLPAR
jgi:hypothetical protein